MRNRVEHLKQNQVQLPLVEILVWSSRIGLKKKKAVTAGPGRVFLFNLILAFRIELLNLNRVQLPLVEFLMLAVISAGVPRWPS